MLMICYIISIKKYFYKERLMRIMPKSINVMRNRKKLQMNTIGTSLSNNADRLFGRINKD
jgi:hypothetical protein